MTKEYELRSYLNTNGFGSSVLQMLLKTSIKKNLYYEIKDRMDEEQFDGIGAVRRKTRKCKVYGATSSKNKRNELIELLHQRVQHHRDKFAAKDIYDELCTMVVKPNGKVEHADDAHDDLVFSYLWALYVFYKGEDLATRFHLMKTEIFTDDHYDETSYSLEEEYMEGEDLDSEVFKDASDITASMVDEQMKILKQNNRVTMEEFAKKQMEEEQRALAKIRSTSAGRQAISDAYHVPVDFLEKQEKMEVHDVTEDIMKMWYDAESDIGKDPRYVGNLSDIFKNL